MAGHTYAQSYGPDKHTNKRVTARQYTLSFSDTNFVCLSFSYSLSLILLLLLSSLFSQLYYFVHVFTFIAIFHSVNVLTSIHFRFWLDKNVS